MNGHNGCGITRRQRREGNSRHEGMKINEPAHYSTAALVLATGQASERDVWAKKNPNCLGWGLIRSVILVFAFLEQLHNQPQGKQHSSGESAYGSDGCNNCHLCLLFKISDDTALYDGAILAQICLAGSRCQPVYECFARIKTWLPSPGHASDFAPDLLRWVCPTNLADCAAPSRSMRVSSQGDH